MIPRQHQHQYGLDLPWTEQLHNYLSEPVHLRPRTIALRTGARAGRVVRTAATVTLGLTLLTLTFTFAFRTRSVSSTLLRKTTCSRVSTRCIVAHPRRACLSRRTLLISTSSRFGPASYRPVAGTAGAQRSSRPPRSGSVPFAYCARLTQGAMLESCSEYVRTAWTKGLGGRPLVVRHVLRDSLVPVLSAVGPLLGRY